MKRLIIYTDTSVIGGCEDVEFAKDSRALWSDFIEGRQMLALSAHTLRELLGAPEAVRRRVQEVPEEHVIVFEDSAEAGRLAEAYLVRGIVGPGSRADALHVALATIGGADVIVSWNFRHVVNLGRIRVFNSVNIELGYHVIEIRTPREVMDYERDP